MSTPLLKKSDRIRFLPDWRTIFSAVLIVVSFPPWNLWPLIWVALIPWFFALNRSRSSTEAAIQGGWLSYFMSLGGFYWVASVLQEFGNLPWVLSILGLQLFCILGQPQFYLFAFLYKYLRSHPPLATIRWTSPLIICLFALAYAGLDWILPKLFLDTLGHSFYLAQNLRQIADIGGAQLLTFLVLIVNMALFNEVFFNKSIRNQSLWNIIKSGSFNKIRPHLQTGVALALCLMSWVYGYYRFQNIQKLIQNPSDQIQAAAIQANIGDFDKIAAEQGVPGAAVRVMDTFTTMTDQAVQLDPKPEIVIWPETSYPSTFRNPHSQKEIELDQRIEDYVRNIKVPLLFGGYDRVSTQDFNAFFFLDPMGSLQVYRKNILLLFGEYIPVFVTLNIGR